jgi:hypothetical protein
VPHAIRATEDLLFSGAESCGPVTSLVRLSFSRWAASICCWAAARELLMFIQEHAILRCVSRCRPFPSWSLRAPVATRTLVRIFPSAGWSRSAFRFCFLLPPSGAGHRFLLFGSVWWLQFLLFDLEGARANESSL